VAPALFLTLYIHKGTIMITTHHKDVFTRLQEAFKNDNVCIMTTTYKDGGAPVTALCSAFQDDQGGYITEPLAIIADKELIELLNSPVY